MKNSDRREGEATVELEQLNIYLFLSAELRKNTHSLNASIAFEARQLLCFREGGVIVSDVCGLSIWF